MPRIGLSITKSCAFRNSTQEFSNVYFFELTGGFPDQAAADGFIDEIATKEKALHSTAVTFVRGRLWKQIGDKTQNEMISQKNLSGTGSTTADSTLDRERAVLIRWRAGNDVRGNPVYLRKWFHCCGTFGGVSMTSSIQQNTAGFSASQRTAMANAAVPVSELGTSGGAGKLVAKSGRTTTPGGDMSAHQFLEHHQLGDQWRAQ